MSCSTADRASKGCSACSTLPTTALPPSHVHVPPVLQELELYKALSHRHVVGYVDHHYDPRGSTLYIFLEYVPGGSIASMLERFGEPL